MRGEAAALNEALARARQEAAEKDTVIDAELISLRADLANRVLEVQELRDVAAGSRAEAAAQRVAFVRARQETAEKDTVIETMRGDATERDAAIERMHRELNSLTEVLARTRQIGATIDQLFDNLRFVFKRKVIILADRAREAGEWTVAAHYYRRALDRNPNRPEIWVQYGHALRESDRLSAAEQAYRRAIAGAPTLAEPYRFLGDVLRALRKRDEAVFAYLQARSLDPTSPDPLSGLSKLGWSKKDLAALEGSGKALVR
jgi:tetratricopeptide (TPR) repeat protein